MSQTLACLQAVVPIGGIVGGLIGVIEGGMIGQTAGGHIGGTPRELLQSGCILPSTHWQMQLAVAGEMLAIHASANTPASSFMFHAPSVL